MCGPVQSGLVLAACESDDLIITAHHQGNGLKHELPLMEDQRMRADQRLILWPSMDSSAAPQWPAAGSHLCRFVCEFLVGERVAACGVKSMTDPRSRFGIEANEILE